MLAQRKTPDFGLWTLNIKNKDGLKQHIFRSEQQAEVLANCPKNTDVYYSQSFFRYPNRMKTSLLFMTHNFVDLDIYNSDYKHHSKDEIIGEINLFLFDNGYPMPTYIIDSGRGLYVFWAFNHFLNAKAAVKFEALNKRLVKLLEAFGADPKATDCSRIFRPIGSFNTKSQSYVEVLIENKTNYTFDYLCESFFEYTADEISDFKNENRSKAKKKKRNVVNFRHAKGRKSAPKGSWRGFHWQRLKEVEELIKKRYGDEDMPKGERDIFAFLAGIEIANALKGESGIQIINEVQNWAANHIGVKFSNSKSLKTYMSTLDAKFRDHQKGKTVTYKGKKKTPIYTPKTETIFGWLKCTPEELEGNAFLRDAKIKVEAYNAQRRKTGLNRAEYLAKVTKKPWEKLGISRRTYYRRLKAQKTLE